MGLLDGALGNVAGSLLGGQSGDAAQMIGGLLKQFGGQGSTNGLLAAAVSVLQQHGGIEGLVAKFQQAGLGDMVQSWIGTGANAPVTAGQLERVLGHDAVAEVASQAGVSTQQAAGGLASVLPELVNQLTPGGSVPANSSELIGTVMGMLRG
ncbi:MAG: YidB family protein [Gemmatimonadaceae bacterium]|nr:YidB family protein [Gemmatimonadaceae bacterium]